MAWARLTTKTLTVAGDSIQPDAVFLSNTFNMILEHGLASGNLDDELMQFGKTSIDTGSNYSFRFSGNGGADSTNTPSIGFIANVTNQAQDGFIIAYMINIAAQEKLAIGFSCFTNTTGAGNAPARLEWVGKWANTTNQFDIAKMLNRGTGDYAIDSNLMLIGTD